MHSYNRNNRQCATCDLWGGQRKLNDSNTWLNVENGANGKCLIPAGQGGFWKATMSHGLSCMHFRLWGALR